MKNYNELKEKRDELSDEILSLLRAIKSNFADYIDERRPDYETRLQQIKNAVVVDAKRVLAEIAKLDAEILEAHKKAIDDARSAKACVEMSQTATEILEQAERANHEIQEAKERRETCEAIMELTEKFRQETQKIRRELAQKRADQGETLSQKLDKTLEGVRELTKIYAGGCRMLAEATHGK